MAERAIPHPGAGDRKVPGPRGYPLLGVLPGLKRDPLRVFVEAAREFGDVVALPVGPKRVYLLNHPDHIKRILQDNTRNYRLTPYYDKLRPVFGKGLLTSEGDPWARQRELIQPAFSQRRLEALPPVITAATATMLERWEGPAARGEPVNIFREMSALTLGIVARAMFGADLGPRAGELAPAIDFLLDTVIRRTTALTGLTHYLPSPRNVRFRRALAALDNAVSDIVAAGQTGTRRRDLLSLLLAARDGRDGMSESQIRDQIKTMLVSGSVTTANALTWTFYLLSRHREVERKLHGEIAEALGGRTPRVGDLDKLPYTKMVIQETLRLYPPTWRLARMAVADDAFGGYRIPAGSIVVFSPYLVHRHRGFWQRPEEFDPERFAQKGSAERPRFAYFPFGGGARACIGSRLAMMEMRLILATVAGRYRLRLLAGVTADPASVSTLRPRRDLMMAPVAIARASTLALAFGSVSF